LGDLAGNFGEAEMLPIVVKNGVDHHTGPEARAILADAPAFLFKLARFKRGAQRCSRLVVGSVFGGIEAREVLTDNLIGRVALESSGTGIPAVDEPFR